MSELTFRKIFLSFLFLYLVPVLVLAQATLVNINTASLNELKTLNGIGDVKAQAIVDYRTQNGPFATIEDIMNVSGIGTATFNNIKEFITVGSVTGNNTNTTSNSEVNQTSLTTSDPNTTTNQSSGKSYWITGNKSPEYEISIGKDRASMVGTPLEFKVETNFGYAKNNIFEWKFGDGGVAYGADVTHTYSFPGEYVVILAAKIPEETLTTRISVLVLAPALVVSQATNERVEISNNSQTEIDLYGRVLVSDGKIFIFPKDTIILPGQKISFSSDVTGLNPMSITQVYLMTVGENPNMSVNGITKSEEIRLKNIAKIENQLSELNRKLLSAYQNVEFSRSAAKGSTFPDTESSIATEESVINSQTTLSTTALSGAESIEELGWFTKFKRFFLRTK